MMEFPQTGEFQLWLLCQYCSRAFTSVDNLVSHKTKVHPKQFHRAFPGKQRRSKRNVAKRSGKTKIGSKSTLPTIDEKDAVQKKSKRVKLSSSDVSKNSDAASSSSKSSTPPPPPATISADSENDNDSKSSSSLVEGIHDDDESTKNRVPEVKNNSQLDEAGTNQGRADEVECALPRMTKESANAFKILFNSSLHMKMKECTKATVLKLRSSTRNNTSTSTAAATATAAASNKINQTQQLSTRKIFLCPHCRRQLQSEETLKMHLKLHESIVIDSNSEQPKMPCKMCKKMLTGPPYKCIDCPSMKMVMDFPNVTVKQEPLESANISNDENMEAMDIDDDDDDFVETPTRGKESQLSTRKANNVEKKTSNAKPVSKRNSSSVGPGSTPGKEPTVYNCGFCPTSFTDPKAFRAHHESNHTSVDGCVYYCKHCNRNFNNRRTRNVHERTHDEKNGKKKNSTTNAGV